jgi:hypothetical protein
VKQDFSPAIHQSLHGRNLSLLVDGSTIKVGAGRVGIVADYRQITEFEYALFKRSPLKAYQSIFGKETNVWKKLQEFSGWTSAILEESRAIQEVYAKTGLYERLHAVSCDPTRLSKQDQLLFEEQKLKLDAIHSKHVRPSWHQFTLDKAWQAIHFLLTGQIDGGNPPLAWAVLGGLELTDEKNYTAGSPLRVLSPVQVKDVAGALSGIPAEQLLSRATITEMASKNIYAVSNDEDSEREHLRTYYEELQQFYADAAQRGNGMLLSLT